MMCKELRRLTASLTELLLRSFGPRQMLTEELEGVEGIEEAYLFGSWAARYAGEAGRFSEKAAQ